MILDIEEDEPEAPTPEEKPGVDAAVKALVEAMGVPETNKWYQLTFYVKRDGESAEMTIHGLALYLHRGATQ